MPRVIAVEREIGGSILALFYNLGEGLGQAMGETVLAAPSAATLKQCHSVIRNALIGGNEGRVDGEEIAVGDTLGLELVETYCYPARPAMHDLALAWQILRAAVYGVQLPEGSKKKEAEESPVAS
jgi:hypothetical protein